MSCAMNIEDILTLTMSASMLILMGWAAFAGKEDPRSDADWGGQ